MSLLAKLKSPVSPQGNNRDYLVDSVIGISYAFCNMSEIPTTDIISNRNVSYIDFRQTNCPYNSNKTSIGDLYDAEQLETL